MRDRISFDIVVSGGGLAGLIATLAFAEQGRSVLCVDPQSREMINDPLSDTRTTALLMPTVQLLHEWGLYDALQQHSTTLKSMRIIDVSGSPAVERSFSASELGFDEFGLNVANASLRKALLAQVEATALAKMWPECAVSSMTARQDEAIVEISSSNGQKSFVSAQLVVAADGRHSPLREGAGIRAKTHEFGQAALTFAVRHPMPHDDTSTEIHHQGGPFTLVPLRPDAGLPRSAVVWMDDADIQQRRLVMEQTAFEEEIFHRSGGFFGPLDLVTARQSWPIITRVAQQLWAKRLILMAEAAHVMPPIGAQGLNTSVADIQTLCALLEQGYELGGERLGQVYDRQRQRDIQLRVGGVSMLNRASQARAPWVQQLRRTGLASLHDISAVRRGLMRLGLGVSSSGR